MIDDKVCHTDTVNTRKRKSIEDDFDSELEIKSTKKVIHIENADQCDIQTNTGQIISHNFSLSRPIAIDRNIAAKHSNVSKNTKFFFIKQDFIHSASKKSKRTKSPLLIDSTIGTSKQALNINSNAYQSLKEKLNEKQLEDLRGFKLEPPLIAKQDIRAVPNIVTSTKPASAVSASTGLPNGYQLFNIMAQSMISNKNITPIKLPQPTPKPILISSSLLPAMDCYLIPPPSEGGKFSSSTLPPIRELLANN